MHTGGLRQKMLILFGLMYVLFVEHSHGTAVDFIQTLFLNIFSLCTGVSSECQMSLDTYLVDDMQMAS